MPFAAGIAEPQPSESLRTLSSIYSRESWRQCLSRHCKKKGGSGRSSGMIPQQYSSCIAHLSGTTSSCEICGTVTRSHVVALVSRAPHFTPSQESWVLMSASWREPVSFAARLSLTWSRVLEQPCAAKSCLLGQCLSPRHLLARTPPTCAGGLLLPKTTQGGPGESRGPLLSREKQVGRATCATTQNSPHHLTSETPTSDAIRARRRDKRCPANGA